MMLSVLVFTIIGSWLSSLVPNTVLGGTSYVMTFIIAEVINKLDAHITMDDRRCADGHRARILHFNNELLRDIDHTKEEFTEVLAEIDAYELYCREHPEYPNNRAVLAIENIREVYKERLKLHDFLQESSAARREQTP